jgi:peptide-methionine (S)-S-oxide reductase
MKSPVIMVAKEDALVGRSEAMPLSPPHLTLGTSLYETPEGTEVAYVAMGCFWGAERVFYSLPGVVTTAVGYQGGFTPNPTYKEVCSGLTGHSEVVKVVYDPAKISFREIVTAFYDHHDPTQGFRQGADIGTQYRSALYCTNDEQLQVAMALTEAYQSALTAEGFGEITTEICPAGPFYYAEEYHQQYLEANPSGYCGIGGTGVSCPTGVL